MSKIEDVVEEHLSFYVMYAYEITLFIGKVRKICVEQCCCGIYETILCVISVPLCNAGQLFDINRCEKENSM